MGIQFLNTNERINLTVPSLKSGGYYTPIVVDGVLSWIPSQEDMPEVETTNIMGPIGETGPQGLQGPTGPKGEKGEQGIPGVDGKSGVYVGNEEPTDPEVLIWITEEDKE